MPIKPADKALYPANWKEIRERILARAGNRCECFGRCGSEHADLRCSAPNGELIQRNPLRPSAWRLAELKCESDADEWRVVKVVLTVAHLDSELVDHSDHNLAALCQRCHLCLDKHQHVGNARATRHKRKAHRELF